MDTQRRQERGTTARHLAAIAAATGASALALFAGVTTKKAEAAPAWSSNPIVTIKNGAINVDGKPFFPEITWAPCAPEVDSIIKLGGNVIAATGCAEQYIVDTIATYPEDIRPYVMPYIFDTNSYPGRIGGAQIDEPDANNIAPEQLQSIPGVEKSGQLTMLTVSTKFMSAWADKATYQRYFQKADFIGVDIYPVGEFCTDSLGVMYHVQQKLVDWAGGKPTFQWIEEARFRGHGWCGPNGQPVLTPPEVRAEAYLAIAGGAKGLGLWTQGFNDRDEWVRDAVKPDISAASASLSHELQGMKDVLLSPIVPFSSDEKDPIKVGIRQHNGQYVAFVVNSVGSPVDNKLPKLPGLGNQPVSEFFAPNSWQTPDGKMGPHSVRIFAYAPTSEAPAATNPTAPTPNVTPASTANKPEAVKTPPKSKPTKKPPKKSDPRLSNAAKSRK